MALGDISANPVNPTGAASAISAAAAWTYGSWSNFAVTPLNNMAVLGISWMAFNVIPAVDTTFQIIVDLATGNTGSEVLFAQIPYTIRNDTQVGYYMTTAESIMLPEPFFIALSSQLSVRIATSLTSSVTVSGMSFILIEESAPVVSFSPVDPFGMMGIFGL